MPARAATSPLVEVDIGFMAQEETDSAEVFAAPTSPGQRHGRQQDSRGRRRRNFGDTTADDTDISGNTASTVANDVLGNINS